MKGSIRIGRGNLNRATFRHRWQCFGTVREQCCHFESIQVEGGKWALWIRRRKLSIQNKIRMWIHSCRNKGGLIHRIWKVHARKLRVRFARVKIRRLRSASSNGQRDCCNCDSHSVSVVSTNHENSQIRNTPCLVMGNSPVGETLLSQVRADNGYFHQFGVLIVVSNCLYLNVGAKSG